MPENYPSPEQLDEFLTFAHGLADATRQVVLQYFRSELMIEVKDDQSPVTIADQTAENLMRQRIAETYPGHSISGEEQGYASNNDGYTWIVDPIDGTQSFICGVPTFGVLIGLLFRGIPILGIVDQPALDERWSAVGGRETEFNGVACQSSRRKSVASASLFCTTPAMFDGIEYLIWSRIAEQARSCRYGLDCYAYGLLASGHVDIVMEGDLKPHDYLPLVPIIEGAGGRISDWQGASLSIASGPYVLAAGNRELHEQLLRLIAAPV